MKDEVKNDKHVGGFMGKKPSTFQIDALVNGQMTSVECREGEFTGAHG